MALPSEYTQLTYIQSDGTQYINTNFIPTVNTRVVMDFQLTKAGRDNLCLFGVIGQFSFRWYGSSSVFRSNAESAVNFQSGIDGTARHIVDKTATTCMIDGTYSVTHERSGNVSEPLYLFAQRTAGGGYTNYCSAKLYSCKIYESNSLVRDFIPAKQGSKVGLYDTVNGVFYTNPELSNFAAGDVYDPTAPVGDHNALIDGTARAIEGGSGMVGGTVYEIEKGDTLVDGTSYEIAFTFPITVTITGGGNATSCYVTINGKSYSSAATLEIESGTEITAIAVGSGFSAGAITLNGSDVGTVETNTKRKVYKFVPDTETVNIKLAYSSSQRYIYITTS